MSTVPRDLMFDFQADRQIKVVKPSQQSAIIPSRRDVLLKRINDMETEIGRLGKLLAEVRADVLHLTTE
jgi:hypothetical protein